MTDTDPIPTPWYAATTEITLPTRMVAGIITAALDHHTARFTGISTLVTPQDDGTFAVRTIWQAPITNTSDILGTPGAVATGTLRFDPREWAIAPAEGGPCWALDADIPASGDLSDIATALIAGLNAALRREGLPTLQLRAEYTTADASRELGISPARVRAIATARNLGVKLSPREWRFSRSDIDAMSWRVPGRPKAN